MDDSCFLSRFSELKDSWAIVEDLIKKAKKVHPGIGTAAINELRYGGRKVIDAFIAYQQQQQDNDNNINDNNINEHLIEAKLDILKARHDVIDETVNFCNASFIWAREKIGGRDIQESSSASKKLLSKINDMQKLIQESRAKREDRKKIYKNIGGDIEYLTCIYNEWKKDITYWVYQEIDILQLIWHQYYKTH